MFKLRMKTLLEQRRQAMLQLHLSDEQSYCLLRCGLCQRVNSIRIIWWGRELGDGWWGRSTCSLKLDKTFLPKNSLLACVCTSVNITCHPFKLESTNVGQKCKTPWLRSLHYCLRGWLTLTFKVKCNLQCCGKCKIWGRTTDHLWLMVGWSFSALGGLSINDLGPSQLWVVCQLMICSEYEIN